MRLCLRRLSGSMRVDPLVSVIAWEHIESWRVGEKCGEREVKRGPDGHGDGMIRLSLSLLGGKGVFCSGLEGKPRQCRTMVLALGGVSGIPTNVEHSAFDRYVSWAVLVGTW